MKKIILLFIFSLVVRSGFGQFNYNWVNHYQETTTPNYSNEGRKIVVDDSSNIYVAADFSADRDSIGHPVGTTQYSIRILKYNYLGVLIKTAYIPVGGLVNNAFSNSSCFGLEIDALGNIYIGYTILNTSGNFDVAVAKYNRSLAKQWGNIYSTTNDDVGVDMKVSSGTVFAVVKTFGGGNTTYSVVSGAINFTSAVLLTSFNTNIDVVNAIYLNSSKNIYVTGYSIISGYKNVMTASLSNTGSIKWKVTFNNGTVTGDDYGSRLTISSDGYIDVIGTTYANIANGNDGIVLRYDISGNLLGYLLLNNSLTDVGSLIINGQAGFVYAACTNTTRVTVYKIQTGNPFQVVSSTSYVPVPVSPYTSITNVSAMDIRIAATTYNVYVCGGVDATSASGNFTASFLVKIGFSGFVFKTLNAHFVDGDFNTCQKNMSMSLDASKADIVAVQNKWSTYTTHTNEIVDVFDYDGGSSLRMAGGYDLPENPISDIYLFPNPASEKIIVRAPEEITSVEITDITGKIIRMVNCYAEIVEINVAGINKGIYFCKIITLSGTASQRKLIIN